MTTRYFITLDIEGEPKDVSVVADWIAIAMARDLGAPKVDPTVYPTLEDMIIGITEDGL